MITSNEQLSVQNNCPPKPKINIEKLVETALPSSPGGLMRIKKMLLDDNTSAQLLGTAISYEMTLSARVMRLANSPIYSLRNNINSIPMAINVVGTRALYDIVMMEIASSAFGKHISKLPLAMQIWEHSLAVAVTARELSRELKLSGTEEAFTCGLLHDIGKMVLLANDIEGFTAIQEADDEYEMITREKRTYGYNHTEVGSLVARRWGLPDAIGYPILHHHNASQATEFTTLTCLIDVADIIANIKGFGLRKEDETKLQFSESAALLRLSDDFLENTWKRVEENIWEIIKSFS